MPIENFTLMENSATLLASGNSLKKAHVPFIFIFLLYFLVFAQCLCLSLSLTKATLHMLLMTEPPRSTQPLCVYN